MANVPACLDSSTHSAATPIYLLVCMSGAYNTSPTDTMVAGQMFRSLVLFLAFLLMLANSEESFLQFPGLAWYNVISMRVYACLFQHIFQTL